MADGLETHGKWPYGGKPDMPPASYEEWLHEVPLRDRKNGQRSSGGRVWRTAADEYREFAKEVGRGDLLIANNEYGMGSGKNMPGFDRYSKGLLMTEMLMEHFVGHWDMTCYWDLVLGTDRGLLDQRSNYRLNPAHLGMGMLAAVQGGKFLHTISTANTRVHGFAATSKDGTVVVYLLNKSGESQSIELEVELELFAEGESNTGVAASAQMMVNTSDGYGEMIDLSSTASSLSSSKDGLYSMSLPHLSFAKIEWQQQ